MRVNELNAQLEAVERALKKLQSDALSMAWMVFPITYAPAPEYPILQRWLVDAGLPDDMEIRYRPGRYGAPTPLLSVPGFSGELPDGWEFVEATSSSLSVNRQSDSVWVHPTLTVNYRQWLANRPQKGALRSKTPSNEGLLVASESVVS
jgi:hypothetical protein